MPFEQPNSSPQEEPEINQESQETPGRKEKKSLSGLKKYLALGAFAMGVGAATETNHIENFEQDKSVAFAHVDNLISPETSGLIEYNKDGTPKGRFFLNHLEGDSGVTIRSIYEDENLDVCNFYLNTQKLSEKNFYVENKNKSAERVNIHVYDKYLMIGREVPGIPSNTILTINSVSSLHTTDTLLEEKEKTIYEDKDIIIFKIKSNSSLFFHNKVKDGPTVEMSAQPNGIKISSPEFMQMGTWKEKNVILVGVEPGSKPLDITPPEYHQGVND